jgi:hypothetical protein
MMGEAKLRRFAMATSERVNGWNLDLGEFVMMAGSGEAEFGSAGTQPNEE